MHLTVSFPFGSLWEPRRVFLAAAQLQRKGGVFQIDVFRFPIKINVTFLSKNRDREILKTFLTVSPFDLSDQFVKSLESFSSFRGCVTDQYCAEHVILLSLGIQFRSLFHNPTKRYNTRKAT